MSSRSTEPQLVDIVILDEQETRIAAVAVRAYLGDMRATYRRNISKGEQAHADRCIEKFDRALELYERLGGDPDAVRDISEAAAPA